MWYLVGGLILVGLALWYFYGQSAPSENAPTSAIEETQLPEPTVGDTTADITTDLEQIPDPSSALDADAAAAASDIQFL